MKTYARALQQQARYGVVLETNCVFFDSSLLMLFLVFEISEIRGHLKVNSMSGFNWQHCFFFVRTRPI